MTDKNIAGVITDVEVGGATAGYRLQPGGAAQTLQDGSTSGTWTSVSGEWLNTLASGDAASNYSVRATLQSGTIESGVLGSWLGLSSQRSWSNDRDVSEGVGQTQGQMLIEIRHDPSVTVIDSCTVILTAAVIPFA